MMGAHAIPDRMESWDGPIDTGEVPEDGSSFDVIVVGAVSYTHLTLPTIYSV